MSDIMKIAILGAGNIGTLIGAKLAQLDSIQLFLHARGDHAANLAVNGIEVKGLENFSVPSEKYEISIADAGVNTIFDGQADVIFICSKAGQVNDLLELAHRLSHPKSKVLVLSNGLGHLEAAAQQFGSHRVIPATTTHGAYRREPGIIQWAGYGAINLGKVSNSPTYNSCLDLLELLEKCGLNPVWNENGHNLIWSKVLINIAINPIAAITGQMNGELLEQEIFDTCVEVMLEGARVARLEGVELDCDEELIQNLKSVLLQTKENKCSMLQDVRMGKVTEIRFLNKMIVSRAERYGLSTPLNQLLSKLIESLTLF